MPTVFRMSMGQGEIGFMEIAPKGDYAAFLDARKKIGRLDCCAITNERLNADNGYYLTIWTHSSMPNCFVDKVAVENMGFQKAAEKVVENWELAQKLKHWFS